MRNLTLLVTWATVLLLSLEQANIAMGQNDGQNLAQLRQRAQQLTSQGNWQDALNIYEKLLVDKGAQGRDAAQDLEHAYQCMQSLGLIERLDPLIAKSLAVRPDDWRFLAQAARTLRDAPHHGQMDGDVFVRNPINGRNGTWVVADGQDRVQALKWLEKALQLTGEIPDAAPGVAAAQDRGSAAERCELWHAMLQLLMQGREGQFGWRLQIKTDIQAKLDYAHDIATHQHAQRHAPVDEQGKPIFHTLPETWSAAISDGQRCRWALQRTQSLDEPETAAEALQQWAAFLQSQFSVDTLREQMWIWSMQFRSRNSQANADQPGEESNKFADQIAALLEVHTLSDDETIAKLANGIQRFTLPEDQNPIRLLQKISQGNTQFAHAAEQTLSHIYLNRRQHPKAVEVLKRSLEKAKERKLTSEALQSLQEELNSIVLARGKFENIPSQVVGRPVQLEFVFRNAKRAEFTARRVDIEKILTRLKVVGRGGKPDYELLQIFDSPGAIFQGNGEQFLSEPVASWKVDLEPNENHWDKRVDIATPLKSGGLYVVDVSLDGDVHKARCSVWVNDLSLIHKPVEKEHWFYVADAVTGAPSANQTVEFIGLGQQFTNLARKTNAEGQVRLSRGDGTDVKKLEGNTWMVVARDNKGRLAVSSPRPLSDYSGATYEERSQAFKAYGVVQQPIYRPGNKVRAKLWLGDTDYAHAKPVANQKLHITVTDPRGKEFWSADKTSDRLGGIELDFDLPDTASLGMYSVNAWDPAGQRNYEMEMRFRVEEFRKPEFEVSVEAPEKGVQLGETVEAKIRAKYYFGTPVTDANVKVKVTRTAFVDDWYPVRPFDWCFGRGYWWFGYTYEWYPGFDTWQGCFPVAPYWRPWGMEPPEVVSDQEVQLDAEGVATVRIDTALAAKFQSKQDHRYEISVEVRDASRRTITSTGSVVAARQPFKIYSWLHRGFYRVNEVIEASFVAQTLNRKPVQGSGKLDLLRITYDGKRQPQETVVESWDARTDENGNFTHKLSARRGGQYRLRLTLKDESGHEVEGAYIFTVRGDNQAADNFRFSELELIPDKAEYAPGDDVELQINADRADANVLVFVRAQGATSSAPRLIQLDNKTAKLTIEVGDSDQPNFFVEAFTVYNGKFYQTVREIFVPPAKKALEVKVTADKKEYLPGEKAKLAIEVKDLQGKPVAGDVLVSVYDRSLEQIAGDALPRDIREFFWKWRRTYYPLTDHTLNRRCNPIALKGIPWMSQLGIFDDLLSQNAGGGMMRGGMMGGLGGGMGGRVMLARGMAVEGAAMPMAMSAPGVDMDFAARGSGGGGAAAPAAETKVRQEFADSALWLTNVKCDRLGHAQAEFTMPENLTDWQMRVWSVGSDLNVGSGASSAVTHKNILIRLAAPRFLTERDQVVLSAIVHNDFDTAHDVQVRLEIDGGTQLEMASGVASSQTVHIEAHQQKRVDWSCRALAEGEVTLRAFAEAAAQSDAMQIKLPIVVNGTLKTDSWAGTIRPDQASSRIQVTIPKERRQEQSRLTVRVSPSLASAIVDALPYLASYPHGCTEQTLNRFLPTALTQRMLIDMQVDLKKVREHRRNLNAQQLGDPKKRAADWKQYSEDAVYDNDEVARMVDSGVQRLTEMQNPDGGWGWFYEKSSAHTTATVVRGLIVARDAGAAIVPDVIERGLAWLDTHQAQRLELIQSKRSIEHTDALVFHTLVMAGRQNETLQNLLYEQRNQLGVYGKVLLALATHKLGNAEQTAMLRQNVEQFLVQDAENETAYLRDQSPWWYWFGSSNESSAYYLKLLANVDAKGPTAARVVKYLLNSRKQGTHWDSTRDTALVVEAFTDYLKATGENKNQVSGEVLLGGKRLGTFQFTPETLFTAENTIEIAGNAVPSGQHELEIRKQGSGPLFFSVYSTNFTLEEEIAPAGLEVKIERRYYRLDPIKKRLDLAGDRGQAIEAERATFDRVLLEDLQAVESGTLVEVELRVESKNDYEYLLIEEHKAAGLEPVDTQSGSIWNSGFYAYRELRDKRVSFYIDHLPRGQHVLSYQLRAEAPGQFTALPAVINGMYAPELVGNSSDKDIAVK